jgi:hypothetical protein
MERGNIFLIENGFVLGILDAPTGHRRKAFVFGETWVFQPGFKGFLDGISFPISFEIEGDF